MLQPLHLFDLRVDAAAHPRGQAHLSAASGLAQAGRFFHVVADDEHHLGVIDPARREVRLHRLLAGDLPAAKEARKRHKPDLETLAALPPGVAWPHGALLALGSGSTAARERGILLLLDAGGGIAGAPRTIDLAPLYRPLRERFADLNIEGGFVAGAAFHLLQRANRGSAVNACITYAFDAFSDWLADARTAPPPHRCASFDLGVAAGVPYGFTDGTPGVDGGFIFSAVAEDTADSYADGRCAGSAIGWVSANGVLQGLLPIAGAPKVEGIALAGSRLLMVTDADDPQSPAQVLQLDWPAVPA